MDEKELIEKLREQKQQLTLLGHEYFTGKELPMDEFLERMKTMAKIETAFKKAIKQFEQITMLNG